MLTGASRLDIAASRLSRQCPMGGPLSVCRANLVSHQAHRALSSAEGWHCPMVSKIPGHESCWCGQSLAAEVCLHVVDLVFRRGLLSSRYFVARAATAHSTMRRASIMSERTANIAPPARRALRIPASNWSHCATGATRVPEPWRASIRPFSARTRSASRRTVRETPSCWANSARRQGGAATRRRRFARSGAPRPRRGGASVCARRRPYGGIYRRDGYPSVGTA